MHRTVDRLVRNICKLFHIDDTSLLEDMESVFKLSKEILEKQNVSSTPSVPDSPPISAPSSAPKVDKKQKKRSRELDRLKVDMKGWNSGCSGDGDYLKDTTNSFSRIHDEFKFKLSDDEETFSDIEEKLYNDDSLNVFMM